MNFRAFFLFCIVLCSSLLADEFDELSHSFSQQVEKGVGLMPDFPSTSPALRRNGDVQQKVVFENKSHCTLLISFSYRDTNGKEQTASMKRHFFLRDFVEGGARRFEVDHKLLTLSFQDAVTKWHLGFHSSTELTRAVSLFTRLIEVSSPPTNNLTSLSQTALQAGFRSLVISPVGPTISDMAKNMFSSPKQSQVVAFLSRASTEDKNRLVAEAENRLPLFVYDLQQLDKSVFYTIASPYENQYSPFSSPQGSQQSALSSDLIALNEDLKMKEVCYIKFMTKPAYTNPKAFLYPPCEESIWKKSLKAHKIDLSKINFLETIPLYWNDRIPIGTDSFWLLSTSPRSDDGLRFWFEENSHHSESHIFAFIGQNYPHLKSLLKQKSAYWPNHTLQEAIQKKFKTLSLISPQLSKEERRVLKIALLTHELGCPFGSEEELSYNSLPFALILAEKVGCTEKEMNMVELLLEKPLLQTNTKEPPLHDLFHSVYEIKQHNVAAVNYWHVQELFFQLLSSLNQETMICTPSRTPQTSRPEEIVSCVCFGVKLYNASLPGRRIYSSYLWEVRDPLHRDGLYLKKLREKYEQYLLEKPTSSWKGKFWQWLDEYKQKKPACPTLYLSENQKELYKPTCKNGKLYLHDGTLIVSEEIMFVVDVDNQLYIGQKKDGKSLEECSFSHASFTAGKPVASSGKIKTDAQGRPILLRNVSGHYRPKTYETSIALKAFQAIGVNLSTLQVSVKADTVTKLPKITGDQFLDLFQDIR